MAMEKSFEGQTERGLIFSAWLLQNRKVGDLISRLGTEDLEREVAPGRNRGLYLLGHLIASNDMLMPLFGFGDKMYPQYEKIFLCSPDKCAQNFPDAQTVKSQWLTLNENLRARFAAMDENMWEADTELSKKRLGALLNIVNHQSYHLGQMAFLL